MKQQGEQLVIEESEKRILEVDMDCLLQKGILCMVDRVIKSIEFSLGVL